MRTSGWASFGGAMCGAMLPVLALVLMVSGCGKSEPQADARGKAFLLATEPAGAETIAAARDKASEETDVLVVGRIHADEFAPWAEDQAAFMISEALPAESSHAATPGHDPATCPFCRRRAEKANATALIQFRDKDGELLPLDARKLLGVKEEQVVVVQGRGHVDELGVLVVAASGIHVRE